MSNKSEKKFEDFSVNISPIPEDEGGGFMVTLPDCPGCVADGETISEALVEARDAFQAWCAAEFEDTGKLPIPRTYSGQFVARIPKSLHRKLAKRAETEGVSLNQMALALIAGGLNS